MSLTRLAIREALAATAQQADPTLHCKVYMAAKMASLPAVCVGDEEIDYVGGMGGGMTTTIWRLWLLLNAGSEWEEAQRVADEYLDFTGDKSLLRAFTPRSGHTPAWQTLGLKDVRLLNYARMPADIQGPNLIDWMGSVYWGVPIRVQVRYGTG